MEPTLLDTLLGWALLALLVGGGIKIISLMVSDSDQPEGRRSPTPSAPTDLPSMLREGTIDLSILETPDSVPSAGETSQAPSASTPAADSDSAARKEAPSKIDGADTKPQYASPMHSAQRISPQPRMWRLNEGERVLKEFSLGVAKGGIYVTNQRVIYAFKTMTGTKAATRSIVLENVDSVDVLTTRPSVLWLIPSALLIIGGIIALTNEATGEGLAGLLAGVAIAAIRALKERKLVVVRSGASETEIEAGALSSRQIQELVFVIESARQDRLNRVDRQIRPDPSNPTVEERLREAERLFHAGRITMDEWYDTRRRIIEDL